jgi:hypothetical protein
VRKMYLCLLDNSFATCFYFLAINVPYIVSDFSTKLTRDKSLGDGNYPIGYVS